MPGKLFWSFFVSVSLAAAFPLWAEIEDSTELSLTVSSRPEAQLAVTQAWTFPVFQGDGFLTSGNNLQTALFYNVSPVSMNAGLDLTLTPIAFAQIKAGGSVGTGWNCTFLDIAPAAWGLNKQEEGGEGGLVSGEPFEAAIWAVYGGAVLQFDIGAVIPGDWTHVLFQTYHQINYRANTLAGSGDSWSHENDGGENRNGFNYYGNYVLGYQMPASPVLKTIALMAEMELKLYAEKDNDFGDELPYWLFSGIANFELNSWFSFAAITQLSLERNFTNWDPRLHKDGDVFYKNRKLSQDKPLSLGFYRFAAILSFKLR
ncbi:MAG: hypothetical protein LBI91_06915 [Spirochaetaceae bacterium]|jgi:hypothetical protein|nr:hypothetical protein [Spirochaetaceae bacterium]